jgi:hypothetical protein
VPRYLVVLLAALATLFVAVPVASAAPAQPPSAASARCKPGKEHGSKVCPPAPVTYTVSSPITEVPIGGSATASAQCNPGDALLGVGFNFFTSDGTPTGTPPDGFSANGPAATPTGATVEVFNAGPDAFTFQLVATCQHTP